MDTVEIFYMALLAVIAVLIFWFAAVVVIKLYKGQQ